MKNYILYNPLSGNGKSKKSIHSADFGTGEKIFIDITRISDYNELFASLEKDDKIIICGGDGTLNRFINSVDNISIQNDVLFLAAGSGNDFLNDLNLKADNKPIKINDYIKNLPALTVNGKSYRFINGIGYGVDGYCCAEKEQYLKKGKKGNYVLIALKGLLYAFKPRNATVCVDGKEYKYSRVWMVTSMKGRFFGGGLMIAPTQDRNNPENSLSVIVAHNLSKLKILFLFLTIFKGKHIKYKKYVAVHNSKEITVKYDKPAPLQIDGEVISDVESYTVTSSVKELETVI